MLVYRSVGDGDDDGDHGDDDDDDGGGGDAADRWCILHDLEYMMLMIDDGLSWLENLEFNLLQVLLMKSGTSYPL